MKAKKTVSCRTPLCGGHVNPNGRTMNPRYEGLCTTCRIREQARVAKENKRKREAG